MRVVLKKWQPWTNANGRLGVVKKERKRRVDGWTGRSRSVVSRFEIDSPLSLVSFSLPCLLAWAVFCQFQTRPPPLGSFCWCRATANSGFTQFLLFGTGQYVLLRRSMTQDKTGLHKDTKEARAAMLQLSIYRCCSGIHLHRISFQGPELIGHKRECEEEKCFGLCKL